MPRFMFIYHADRDMRPAPGEEEAAMAAWGRWMEEVGPAMVNPGDPVGKSKSVTKDGIADDVLNAAFGYSIVEADDIDAACKMAQSNPMVLDGGSVEVAEIMAIQM